MCPPQLFTSFTPDQFTCLLTKARAAGIAITATSGTSSKDGITIEWAFDPAAQTLSIQCTAAPFFIPCETINTTIQNLVAGCP